MKNIMKLIVVTVFCFATLPVFAGGVLVDVKGDVSVISSDKKESPAKIGMELSDGTKITTQKSSSASVMLMNGTIDKIDSKKTYTVGSEKQSVKNQTVIDGIALAMNEVIGNGSSSTIHGMVKMSRLGLGAPESKPFLVGDTFGPQGIYPVETAIVMPKEIYFHWKLGKMDFPNPVVVVENDARQKIAVEKIGSPKSIILVPVYISLAKLKLVRGKSYSWYLASKTDKKFFGKSRRFNFSILSNEDEKRLNEDKQKIFAMDISDDGKNFLTAQLYYRFGMYHDMLNTLLPIWEKEKTDSVKKLLFFCYRHIGLEEEAAKFE